jgi:hypothetical protein
MFFDSRQALTSGYGTSWKPTGKQKIIRLTQFRVTGGFGRLASSAYQIPYIFSTA